MKKLEKQILLKDLDYNKTEYLLKIDKLNMIISLYLDDDPDTVSDLVDKKVKEEESNSKDKELEKDDNDNSVNDEESENEINIEEINKDNEIINLPNDIKTLYRKIVMLTHPDKNNGNDNNVYKDYYKRVIEAKNKNDKSEIIYIAYKLNLNELYDINEEHYGSIKKKIKELEMTSNNINSNSFWIWYHTDNEQLKKVMSYQISKNR